LNRKKQFWNRFDAGFLTRIERMTSKYERSWLCHLQHTQRWQWRTTTDAHTHTRTHTLTRTYTHTHTHLHTHMHTHTHTLTRTYTLTHARTLTHTHTLSFDLPFSNCFVIHITSERRKVPIKTQIISNCKK